MKYEKYTNITKELLDSIKTGDMIRINDWKKGLRVKGATENYFYMSTKQFGNEIYSICEKIKHAENDHNNMKKGMFHVGVQGNNYYGARFDTEEEVVEYLTKFRKNDEVVKLEDGTQSNFLSRRNGTIPIYELYIKRS